MRIINTFDTISSCFIDDQFDLEAWRKYTKTFSCELSEKCEQDSEQYDFKMLPAGKLLVQGAL